MGATVSAIRIAIAQSLSIIPGLRTSDFVPDNPSPPMAVVEPTTIDYDQTFGRGLDSLNFTINVVVGRVSDRVAQNELDSYINSSGDKSVKRAVELDRTLGGLVQDCRVTGLTSYGSVSIGDNTYLSAEFAVRVYSN